MKTLVFALIVTAQIAAPPLGTGSNGQPSTTKTSLEVPATGVLSIASPQPGQIVSGVAGIMVKHSNPLAQIQILIDGVPKASGGGGIQSYAWDTAGVAAGDHLISAISGDNKVTVRVVIQGSGVPGPSPEPDFCKQVPAVLVVKTWPNYKNATATSPNFTFTSPAPMSSITFYAAPIRAIALDSRGCSVEVKK